jgi:cytochrome c-type biogenesis protein CcsB
MSENFIFITFWLYLSSSILYLLFFFLRRDKIANLARIAAILGVTLNIVALIFRTYEAGHSPLTNQYESMVLFSLFIVSSYIFFEVRYKMRTAGAFIVPLGFLSLGFASVLPERFKEPAPLLPALQSYWLEIHVITCFLGYAFFALAFGASIMYLLSLSRPSKFPSHSKIDDICYKSIALGFPLLSIGIITGAVWANYAWGTYWSWDPKETWSLITWLIYAAYLHSRITGWKGKKSAYLSIIGFLAVIFTYAGVNFLLSGLHSYG